MYNSILCRYHEIATKGNNRNVFERCLADNIKYLLKPAAVPCRVHRVRGRIWVDREDRGEFSSAELEAIRPQLAKAFGLESFSPVVRLPVDMEAIRAAAVATARSVVAPALEGRGRVTFRVRARRSNKKFPLRSTEIEIDLVTHIAALFAEGAIKIDLDHAELTLGCEVRDEFAALYWERFAAPGGLPVGSNPRVLTLLSGGIDSPVAAYLAMKRGCPTDFLTFHSAPYTPPESVDKVRGLAALLNTFQLPGKFHSCNLAPFQKEVRDRCRERFRTVLYRRAMLRIAEKLARRTGCRALVTGEAVGQVASQTVVNLDTIGHAADILVLRPLIGADKHDAIAIAEKIGTFPLSSVPAPDSCTVFAPGSPSTAVPRALAEAEERKIPDYPVLIEKIADDIETFA